MWILISLLHWLWLITNAEIQDGIMPELIEPFCPSMNVCSKLIFNITTLYDSTDVMNSICCTDCTCEETCQYTDCCFLTLVNISRSNAMHQCVQTALGKMSDIDGPIKSYYMISNSVDDTQQTSDRNSGNAKTTEDQQNCGDMDVGWWGSILPVFSPTTKQIYKNVHCANSHSVTDGITWLAYLDCRTFGFDPSKSITILDITSAKYLPHDCKILFSPPESIAFHVESLMCYNNITFTCPTNFTIPNALHLSTDDVKVACKHGKTFSYVKVIQTGEVYANIFCYLCNMPVMADKFICLSKQNDIQRSVLGVISLLSTASMTPTIRIPIGGTPRPHACNCKGKFNENCCRQVYCPSGQILNELGKCVPFIEVMYDVGIDIFVHVSPDRSIKTLFSNPRNKTYYSDFSWLVNPWKASHWQIAKVFIATVDCSSDWKWPCEEVVISLKYKKSEVVISDLTVDIVSTMKKTWKICLEECITARQQFSRFSEFGILKDFMAKPYWAIHSESLPNNSNYALYNYIESKIPPRFSRAVRIRKTFLCKQIALTPNEYILGPYSLIIKTDMQRRFYDNEFEMSVNANEELRPRICLEDSGYIEVSKDVASFIELEYTWYILMIYPLTMYKYCIC